MNFPFGEPVRELSQCPLDGPASAFILGVYASAVHARWYSAEGRLQVQALAVASEPEIFWAGDGASEIIAGITVPREAGFLVPADPKFNGPSGRVLDSHFLRPLGLKRTNAWLCDLLPSSRVNDGQRDAHTRSYEPLAARGIVPKASCPAVPRRFSDRARREAILEEFQRSRAETLVTLGDVPLREFAAPLGLGRPRLADYGSGLGEYGRHHEFSIDGRAYQLLPLAHPRQAGSLGRSSATWTAAHHAWMARRLAGAT